MANPLVNFQPQTAKRQPNILVPLFDAPYSVPNSSGWGFQPSSPSPFFNDGLTYNLDANGNPAIVSKTDVVLTPFVATQFKSGSGGSAGYSGSLFYGAQACDFYQKGGAGTAMSNTFLIPGGQSSGSGVLDGSGNSNLSPINVTMNGVGWIVLCCQSVHNASGQGIVNFAGSLNWQKRTLLEMTGESAGTFNVMEIWWAPAGPGIVNVAPNFSDAPLTGTMMAFGVDGAAAWDANGSLPNSNTNPTGATSNPSTGPFSVTASQSFSFAFGCDTDNNLAATPSPAWASIQGNRNFGGGTVANAAVYGQANTAALAGVTMTWTSQTNPYWGMIVDAIRIVVPGGISPALNSRLFSPYSDYSAPFFLWGNQGPLQAAMSMYSTPGQYDMLMGSFVTASPANFVSGFIPQSGWTFAGNPFPVLASFALNKNKGGFAGANISWLALTSGGLLNGAILQILPVVITINSIAMEPSVGTSVLFDDANLNAGFLGQIQGTNFGLLMSWPSSAYAPVASQGSQTILISGDYIPQDPSVGNLPSFKNLRYSYLQWQPQTAKANAAVIQNNYPAVTIDPNGVAYLKGPNTNPTYVSNSKGIYLSPGIPINVTPGIGLNSWCPCSPVAIPVGGA